VGRSACQRGASSRGPVFVLRAGLDVSRGEVEVCLLSSRGEIVDEWASPPDADGLRGLAARAAMWARAVRGVIDSMNGARFVHDALEERGRGVLIADATEVKGAGAVGLQDRQDRRACAGHRVGPRSRAGDLAARPIDPPRARARRFRLHRVRHRATLKNRARAALIASGHPCPVSVLLVLGVGGVLRRRGARRGRRPRRATRHR
jgi:transposase